MSQHYFGNRATTTTSSMNSAAQSGARALLLNTMGRSGSAQNVQGVSGRNLPRAFPILERESSSMRNMRSVPDRRRNASGTIGGSSRRFLIPSDQQQQQHGHSHNISGSTNNSNDLMSLSAHFGRVNRRPRLHRSNSTGSIRSLHTTSDSETEGDVSSFSISSLSIASRTIGNHTYDDSAGSSMASLFSRDSANIRQRQLEAAAANRSAYDPYDDEMLSVASSECTVYSFDVCPPSLSLLRAAANTGN